MKSTPLYKSKKDLMNMYGAGITPDQKAHVNWASSKLPNENWSLWVTRAHRANPAQFTPEMKEKIEHFAGSQHIPEIAKTRFEKHHDLPTGMKMLEDAEGEYNKKISANTNVVKPDEHTQKVLDVGNGMGWYSLNRGSCTAEGKAMGHCGNAPSEKPGDRVLSLRTEHKTSKGDVLHEPHATFIVNGGYLGEMKGRGNTKPAKKYHKAIADLLIHPKIKGTVGGGYLHHQNFNVQDLEPSERKRVLDAKPNINVYANDTVPDDLPDKFSKEVKSVVDFRNEMKETHKDNWRQKAIESIAGGKSPKMALNAINNPTDDELHSIITSPDADYDHRVQAAMVGKDKSRLHRALATHHPDDVRYLNNPDVDAIIGSGNTQAIESLSGHEELSDKDIDKIIGHPSFNSFSTDTHTNIMQQKNLNPVHQERFLNSPHQAARATMARHSNLDPKFHERLANDSVEEVRHALAGNFDISLDQKAQDRLAEDPSESVREELAKEGKISPETQNKLFSSGKIHPLASNANLHPEMSEKIANYAAKNDPDKIEDINGIRSGLLGNDSTSPKALHALYHGKKFDHDSRLYHHKNLPKELFDEMVKDHSSDPEKFADLHGHILSNEHLDENQFKKLKTKYGRQKKYEKDFKDHPMYKAKEDEIVPGASQKMLANHLGKLKEQDPEKHKATQQKLVNQAIEHDDEKEIGNLIGSGVLDDEHHKLLHDKYAEAHENDSWRENRDYTDMLKKQLGDESLPTSYHDEILNRLEQNRHDSDDIAEHVFEENKDSYYDDASDAAREAARENYTFDDYLNDHDRNVRRDTHPLDHHIENASSGRSYYKADLSDLHDMAEQRAKEQHIKDGKMKPDESVEDSSISSSDHQDALSDAKDSVHEDMKDYITSNGSKEKFTPEMRKELDKYRDHLYEDYDESISENDSDYFHDALMEQKDKLSSDPTMWPKHLQNTKWVKENIGSGDGSSNSKAGSGAYDEFGVEKSLASSQLLKSTEELAQKARKILNSRTK